MTEGLTQILRTRGVVVARQSLPAEHVLGWRQAADDRYAEVDEIIAQRGPWAVADTLAFPFVPTASSLGLAALGEQADSLLQTLSSILAPTLEAALGGPVRPLMDSMWLRRQFAPENAPPYHAPHAWHQDGGLGFDYLGDADLVEGLLPMVTCWCPLMPCGRDAPGMAYLPNRPGALMALDALGALSGPGQMPNLLPGDVLLMMGDLLHRTHVTSDMKRDRISVEVRFVPADHPGRRGPWSGATK